MSQETWGYPRLTLWYWRELGMILAGVSVWMLVFSGLGAAIVFTQFPDSWVYFSIALVGAFAHLVFIFARSIWTGQIDVEEMADTTLDDLASAEGVTLLSLTAIYITSTLVAAALIASFLGPTGGVGLLAGLVAIYYFVFDVLMVRQLSISPAAIPIWILLIFLAVIGVIRTTKINDLPLLGRHHRLL